MGAIVLFIPNELFLPLLASRLRIAFANKPDKRNALLAAHPDAMISSPHDITAALTS